MNFFFTCISFFSIHNDNYDEEYNEFSLPLQR